LLLLRQLVGKPSVRALVYDGVRKEESQTRFGYLPVSEGAKHVTQTNVSPLLEWSASEIFVYLLSRGILFNRAYRYGFVRVGCAVCPFSSRWTNHLSWAAFRVDVDKFIGILLDYGRSKGLANRDLQSFIGHRLWAGRAGGRDIVGGGTKVLESVDHGTVALLLREPRENWLEWSKALGTVVKAGPDRGYITTGKDIHAFEVIRYEHGVGVAVQGVNGLDRVFMMRLRATANKAAYCVHCRSCEVECPTGALRIQDRVTIDETKCVSCGNCLSVVEKGCLVAKSLGVSEGGGHVKGLNRYQQFGMRKVWLDSYLADPDNWWHKNELGNRQFEAMRVWLREAEIVRCNEITLLGARLRAIGTQNPLTWAVIWTNLVRNSVLVRWYVEHVPWGTSHTRHSLVEAMGDTLARRSRENAVDALVDLLKGTPLGAELGLGEIYLKGRQVAVICKRGWERVHPLAVLYVLYRYAERQQRYDLSVRELCDEPTESPYALFGIGNEQLIPLLRGLSSRWGSWITVELVRDLDNIFLDKNRRSEEVLDLA